MDIIVKEINTILGKIKKVTLINDFNMRVTLLSYGASIYQISIAGIDITVKPDGIDPFLVSNMKYGKTIGRQSGRILLKPFSINGIHYMPSSNGFESFQLHGGDDCFAYKDSHLVAYKILDDVCYATFNMKSKHLEGGYPGDIDLNVIYALSNQNQLTITYEATTTYDTYLNITNHTYFNLSCDQSALSHRYLIPSKHHLRFDEAYNLIGSSHPIKPFDFNCFNQHDLIQGYDDVYMLSDQKVVVDHSNSPYKLQIDTDYPAMVFYTHNLRNEDLFGYHNQGLHAGFALEAQYPPLGIHEEKIYLPLLKRNETYKHYIQFSLIKKP